MKPRITLTDQQLDTTAEARIRGLSWSEIGRNLSVNRQIVKREYTNWERVRGNMDLTSVRREVAAEEFREHLAKLTELAEEISQALDRASSLPGWLTLKNPLANVTESADPIGGDPNGLSFRSQDSRHRRQRRWLYEALEAHLSATSWRTGLVRWNSLRTQCQKLYAYWEEEGYRRCKSLLTDIPGLDPKPGLDQVRQVTDELLEIGWLVITEMACREEDKEGILFSRWKQVVDSSWKPKKYFSITRHDSSSGSGAEVRVALLMQGKSLLLPLASEAQGFGVQQACAQWVAALLRHKTTRHLTIALKTLLTPLREMVELLDPLRLRPILLRTRCDLCAV